MTASALLHRAETAHHTNRGVDEQGRRLGMGAALSAEEHRIEMREQQVNCEVGARRSGFFQSVYAVVKRIPRGKVATYGQIARMLGAPRSARIVGWAMHGNPHGSRVPCHRVVQQGGSLSPNYCVGDPGRQRRLLGREGVTFLLGGRVDMAAHQWDPAARPALRSRQQG